jgi:hypothetical protein
VISQLKAELAEVKGPSNEVGAETARRAKPKTAAATPEVAAGHSVAGQAAPGSAQAAESVNGL